MFQIPRACGLNYICKITHVTQINVKWFVFIFSAIKCRFKRVPVDFGPALEFRLTRRRSLSRFIGREDKFSYSRKILTVKCLFHPCCSLFLFFSPLMFIEFWGFIQQRPIYLMQEYAFSIPKNIIIIMIKIKISGARLHRTQLVKTFESYFSSDT